MSLQEYIASTGLEEFENLKTDEAEPIVANTLIDAGEIVETQHLDTAGDIEGTVEQINTLQEVEASLEAYIDILNATGSQGIDRTAAAVLSVGLQRVSRILGPVEIPSTECFGGTMSRREATGVSMEALSAHLENAGSKIKELVQNLIQLIVKFASEMMNDIGALTQKTEGLRDKAKGLKGEATKVSLWNVAVVSVDGQFVGHNVTSILPLIQYLDQKWIPGARRLIEVAAQGGDDVTGKLTTTAAQCGFDAVAGKSFPGGLSFGKSESATGISLPAPKFDTPEAKTLTVDVEPGELFQRAQLILKALGDYSKASSDYKAMNSSLDKLKSSTALDRAKQAVHEATSDNANTTSPAAAVQAIISSAGADYTRVSKHIFRVLTAMVGVLAYEIATLSKGE